MLDLLVGFLIDGYNVHVVAVSSLDVSCSCLGIHDYLTTMTKREAGRMR